MSGQGRSQHCYTLMAKSHQNVHAVGDESVRLLMGLTLGLRWHQSANEGSRSIQAQIIVMDK